MASLQAARAFYIDAMSEAWDTVSSSAQCSLNQPARVMSANQALQRSAVAAIEAVLPLAWAGAVYADNPTQWCFRDLHAASHHIFYGVDVLKDIGQVALGRTSTSPRL
jgi:hypothetical protein